MQSFAPRFGTKRLRSYSYTCRSSHRLSTCEAPERRFLGRFAQHARRCCARRTAARFYNSAATKATRSRLSSPFRKQSLRRSLLAKTVASRNALRFDARDDGPKEEEQLNSKNKKRRRRRQKETSKNSEGSARCNNAAPSRPLGVSLGNCALGFVGDRSRDGSQREASPPVG